MLSLTDSFRFIADQLYVLMYYFMGVARGVALVSLTIAICAAALNYGLTGTGLKENIIKILKAVVFSAVVLAAYPRIVAWITENTYKFAKDSVWNGSLANQAASMGSIQTAADEKISKGITYGGIVIPQNPGFTNPFDDLLHHRTGSNQQNGKAVNYYYVSPGAALQATLLVAGECIRASDDAPKNVLGVPDAGAVFKGLLCAFFVLFVGVFAVLEYIIALMEFLMVASVGVSLVPFTIWDGSKFLTEKFIGAMVGFFFKLLFSTLCIFLNLYIMISLAKTYVHNPFVGGVDQLMIIIFSSLLGFYLCKSAPALAQSLLTGTPSLNAAGAIGAVASAVGAAAGVAKLGAGAAGLATQAAVAGGGALAKAGGAAAEASKNGGSGTGAFFKSLAGSVGETASAAGSDLTRSLVSHSPLRGGQTAQALLKPNADSTHTSLGGYFKEQAAAGRSSVPPPGLPKTPAEAPAAPKPKAHHHRSSASGAYGH